MPSADLVEAASEIVDRVGQEMAADPIWQRRLLEPPHVDRIDALGPTGITLRIGGRVAAGHRWTAVGEVRRRLLDAFRRRACRSSDRGEPRRWRPVAPPPAAARRPSSIDDAATGAPGQDDPAQGMHSVRSIRREDQRARRPPTTACRLRPARACLPGLQFAARTGRTRRRRPAGRDAAAAGRPGRHGWATAIRPRVQPWTGDDASDRLDL